jgi:hypothetical protein
VPLERLRYVVSQQPLFPPWLAVALRLLQASATVAVLAARAVLAVRAVHTPPAPRQYPSSQQPRPAVQRADPPCGVVLHIVDRASLAVLREGAEGSVGARFNYLLVETPEEESAALVVIAQAQRELMEADTLLELIDHRAL